jgi:hypothetical protein
MSPRCKKPATGGEQLALDEIGLFTCLCGWSPRRVISRASIGDHFGIGRERTARLVRSLERAGYLRREISRATDRTFGLVCYVLSQPNGKNAPHVA